MRIARDEAKFQYDECSLFAGKIEKEMQQLADTFGKFKVKQQRLEAQLNMLDKDFFGIDFVRKDQRNQHKQI